MNDTPCPAGKRRDGSAAGVDAPARNLTYALLDAVGRTIVTGGYDGRRFPTEAALAAEHAVSRSVTREAVKMLTAKGLLTARPRTGTAVQPASSWNLFDPDVLRWTLERKFSLELLRHFSELRAAIEPAAAALAAQRADADASDADVSDRVGAIAAGFARMEAAERGADDPLDADIAFHIAVLGASNNPFYIQFKDVVATALRTSIRFTNRFANRTADLPAHGAVLDAIRVGDGARAAAAMGAIVGGVRGLIDDAESAERAERAG